ncbi:MAG: hypothetical protein ACOYOA_11730 [Saprospiraceae bacterium]
MKRITIIFWLVFLLVDAAVYAQTTNNCQPTTPVYVQKQDGTGEEPYTGNKLETLQAISLELLHAFPEEYCNSFKVFDYGFSPMSEYKKGNYTEDFMAMKSEAHTQANFYLIFARQVDAAGKCIKIWVDVNLPTNGRFGCLSKMQRDLILIRVQNVVNENITNENSAYSSEQKGIEFLRLQVKNTIDCCTNRNRDGSCTIECGTFKEKSDIIKRRGYISLSGLLSVESDISVNAAVNATGIFDYANITINGIKVSLELGKKCKKDLESNGLGDYKVYISDGCSDENNEILQKIIDGEKIFHYIFVENNNKYAVFCNTNCMSENVGDNEDGVVVPLSFAMESWYWFIGHSHVIRATDYAVKFQIPKKDFHYTSFESRFPSCSGERSQVLVHRIVRDNNGNTILENKSIFRQSKSGININDPNCVWYRFNLYCNDTWEVPFNNYYDSDGQIIFWEEDLSDCIIDGTPLLSGGATTCIKFGRAVVLLGQAKKAWSVYTFVTTARKSYYGITFRKVAIRIAEHINRGKSVFGNIDDLGFIKDIPDKDIARGIEQLFINWGRSTKTITDQINSINPARVEIWNMRITKALNYLKNHPNKDYQNYYNLLKDYTAPVK